MGSFATIKTGLRFKERGLSQSDAPMKSDGNTHDSGLKALNEEPSLSTVQYVSRWKTKQGEEILLRPIRPEDEPMMVKFHATLSDQTVYLRYFHMEKLSTRVAHERLVQKCFVDYDHEMALVAERIPDTGQPEIIAVGRLTKSGSDDEGELAVLVSDRYQRHGLGVELVRRLIQVGRDQKLKAIVANILPENYAMRALADRFGFKIRESNDPMLVVAALNL
jgi:acetyltransferase